jgi:uncharacterized linocin/CFP29 family protein
VQRGGRTHPQRCALRPQLSATLRRIQVQGQPFTLKVVADAAQAVAMREEEFVYRGQLDFHLPGLLTAEGRNILQGGDGC